MSHRHRLRQRRRAARARIGVTARRPRADRTASRVYGVREDGGFGRMLSDDARAGLAALGYDGDAIAALARTSKAAARCAARRASVSTRSPQLGLTEPALEAIEEAARDAFNLRAAVHPLVIGPELCEEVLKLPPDVAAGKRGDLLMTLGFSEDEIAAAEAYCMGASDFTRRRRARSRARRDLRQRATSRPTRASRMAAAVAPFARTALDITLDADRSSTPRRAARSRASRRRRAHHHPRRSAADHADACRR